MRFLSLFFLLTLLATRSYSQDHRLLFQNASQGACYNYCDIGNVSISGTALTVEASINLSATNSGCMTSPYHDVVSKHYDNLNVNYLLRPDHAELNTSSGFHTTTAKSSLNANTCTHIAMVYDGAFLRFYKNGILEDSVAATGNLITNSLHTLIGYSAGFNPNYYTQFFGSVDEVRIWNVARSAQDLYRYRNRPLDNVSAQAGLVAYYTFEDGTRNIQGNALYNGVLTGNVSVQKDNNPCIVTAAAPMQVFSGFAAELSPNPFSGEFSISTRGEGIEPGSLEIYDLLGRTVFSKKYDNIIGLADRINLENISPGPYWLSIITKSFKTGKMLMKAK